MWGFEKLHMVEKVHIEFLRSIIRVNKSPHYTLYTVNLVISFGNIY